MFGSKIFIKNNIVFTKSRKNVESKCRLLNYFVFYFKKKKINFNLAKRKPYNFVIFPCMFIYANVFRILLFIENEVPVKENLLLDILYVCKN